MRLVPNIVVLTIQLTLLLLSACGVKGTEVNTSDHFSDPLSAKLAQAVVVGDLAEMEKLVNSGASVNAVDKNGLSLLDWAVNQGQKESFRKLLDLKADPNLAEPISGSTSLHWAALNSDPYWISELIRAGADPNLENARKETAIFDAISSRSTAILDTLIEAGANVDHQNSLGQTPAMSAAVTFNYELVLHLLRRGACTEIVDNSGNDLRAILSSRVPASPDRAAAREQVLTYLAQFRSDTC